MMTPEVGRMKRVGQAAWVAMPVLEAGQKPNLGSRLERVGPWLRALMVMERGQQEA